MSLQWPMVDLRAFLAQGRRLSKPSWPDPRPGTEFIRGVGVVRERRRGGNEYWFGEQSFCDAKKLLRLPASRAGTGWSAEVEYCRLFGFQTGYRLDIGITLRAAEHVNGRAADYRWFAEEVMTWPTQINGRATALGSCSTPLRSALLRRTSAHGTDLEAGQRWLTVGRPMMLSEDRSGLSGPGTVCAGNSVRVGNNVQMPTFAVSNENPELRAIRVALWRLHTELEALREIGRVWQEESPADESVFDLGLMLGYLTETCGRLLKQYRFGTDQSLLLVLSEAVGGFDRSDLAALADHVAGRSLGVARQIELLLERTEKRRLRPMIVISDEIKIGTVQNLVTGHVEGDVNGVIYSVQQPAPGAL